MCKMRLRELNVGCFGGGTGLPSLLGGLKSNPWLHANAVVTMFDSGGSSGVLRDELGVLPPGDILKCALALSRNAREARRVLLARLPTLEHAQARRAHRRQPAPVDDAALQRRLPRRDRRTARAARLPRPRVAGQRRSRRRSAPSTATARSTRGEVEVDAGQSSGRLVHRIWLEPPVAIHPAVARAIGEFDAVTIGPGSFYTSLMPIFLVSGVPEALQNMKGPVILVANLLTEGRGMVGFTAADAVARIEEAIQRPVDVVITNVRWPSPKMLGPLRARAQGTARRSATCRTTAKSVGGEFWTSEIARHDRLRLAYAVWSVLSRRLLVP